MSDKKSPPQPVPKEKQVLGGIRIVVTAIHEPLPANHPMYSLVGRVASEWSHYESVLDTIIWGLASLQGPIGACITAQIMGAGPRLVAIKALASEVGFIDQISDQLNSLEQATYDPQERRNRTLHDPWYWDKMSTIPKQQRSKPKKGLVFGMVPVDEKFLTKLIQDIYKLRYQSYEIRAAVAKFTSERQTRLAASQKKPS